MNSILRTLLFFVALTAAGFAQSAPDFAATKKKAEAGDAAAQFNLGWMYVNANGDGVPKYSAEAVKWYRKAADQGYANAQFNLGVMYAIGEGVPKDLVQAHVWLNIAGTSGNANAKTYLAILEKQMTADQKAESMKLARDLFAKLPKEN
jgi:TPR repeat protein